MDLLAYPSFNHSALEACSQDRIEKLSNTMNSLNPFEEKRDYFATSVLSESVNLQFDTEGRVSLTEKLLNHANIKIIFYLLVLEKLFKSGNQKYSKSLNYWQEKKLIKTDQILNGKINRKGNQYEYKYWRRRTKRIKT